MFIHPLQPKDFLPGKVYEVFFERDVPLEVKFLNKSAEGNFLCQDRHGKIFSFYSIGEYLDIRTVEKPDWY